MSMKLFQIDPDAENGELVKEAIRRVSNFLRFVDYDVATKEAAFHQQNALYKQQSKLFDDEYLIALIANLHERHHLYTTAKKVQGLYVAAKRIFELLQESAENPIILTEDQYDTLQSLLAHHPEEKQIPECKALFNKLYEVKHKVREEKSEEKTAVLEERLKTKETSQPNVRRIPEFPIQGTKQYLQYFHQRKARAFERRQQNVGIPRSPSSDVPFRPSH
jgi:hypothetical protein